MVSSATTRKAKKAKKAEDAAEQARIALEASKKGAQEIYKKNLHTSAR